MEKALYARRLLLSGRQVPEVYATEVAREHADTAIAELDKEIESLLFETRVRREVVSDTVTVLLSARPLDARRRSTSRKPNPSIRGRSAMAAFSNGTGLRRRWFLTLSLVAAAAVIVVGVVLWQAVELSSLATVSERVDRLKPLLGGIRLALIGALAVVWPWLSSLRSRA